MIFEGISLAWINANYLNVGIFGVAVAIDGVVVSLPNIHLVIK
jgi:hypothetical protein